MGRESLRGLKQVGWGFFFWFGFFVSVFFFFFFGLVSDLVKGTSHNCQGEDDVVDFVQRLFCPMCHT